MKLRFNKALSALLAFLITFNLFAHLLPPLPIHAAFSGGSGTVGDPYLVSTAEDFLSVASYPSRYFRQTCDISFAGYTVTPVSSFSGTYDGGGFAITDIVYNGSQRGMFAANKGTIKNLSFRDCDITVNFRYVDDYAGGIVGINNGTVSDCSFDGKLTVQTTNAYYDLYGGGIVGKNTGTVQNCKNQGTVLVSVAKMGGAAPAGIVGYNTGTVVNCLNEGSISTNNAGSTMCGGIVGYNEGTVRSVKNTGNISGETCWHDSKKPSTVAQAGGIVGLNKGLVSYGQNYGTIETSGTANGDHAYAGGIVGYNGNNYNDPGPYVVEYSKNYGQVLAHSQGGEGRAGGIAGTVYKNSYVRYCCNEGYVNASDSAKYSSALAGGITAIVQYGTASQCCNHGEVRANTLGYDSLEVCGVAAGSNAVITDCYNDGDLYSDYRGSSRYAKVAGIVVDTDATCQNSFNLGTLNAVNAGSRKYGVYSHDGAWNKNVILSCYTTNLYTNTESSMKITDEQAKKKETFVGYDFNRIWAIDPEINGGYPYLREIPADDDLNFYIDPALIVPVTGIALDQTYIELDQGESATLTVTVLPENALNKKIFWYTSNTGIADVDDKGNVTAGDAGTAYIYAETEDGGYTAVCTVTVLDRNPVFSGGSGTANDPYLIATADELQNMLHRRKAHYRLISNISLEGVAWTPIGTKSNPFGGSLDGGGFVIDGLNVSAPSAGYAGLFGYSVGTVRNVNLTNVRIAVSTDTSALYCGGIAGYNTGAVTSCTVDGVIRGTTLWERQNACVGGICGYSSQSVVSACFDGTVTAKVSQLDSIAYCGGIVGYGTGARDCRSYGSVIADGALDCDCYAGGIIGCATGNIASCYNGASIVSKNARYAFAGGIAGLNAGTVTSCKNRGSVYSYTCFQGSSDGDPTPPDGALAVLLGGPEALAGGITGSNYSTVSFCENLGAIHAESISSSAYAGGIAGYNNESSTLEDLKNSGSVLANSTAGEARAGGIASSSHYQSMVRRCCNTGSVTITETGLYNYGGAGGILAVLQYGTVTQCCNHGNVHATATLYEPGAGGILSSLSSSESYNMIGTLSDCYNDGTVSCTFSSSYSYRYGYLKGITGVSDHGNIVRNCYNVGTLKPSGRVETHGLFKVWGNTSYTATGCYVTALHQSTDQSALMTDEQSRQQSTYAGYDFTNVWAIDPEISGGRPYLQTLPSPDDSRWYSGLEEIVRVDGIVLDKEALEIHIGASDSLSATVTPENATNAEIKWTVSDPSVIEVSQSGIIRAKAPGTAIVTVTAADRGFTATCFVTVTDHAPVTDEAVEATCTATGLTEGAHCSICNKILTAQTQTPMIPHTYDDRYDALCNVCGYERVADCAHKNTEILEGIAPTCTEEGLTEGARCADCGEITVPQEDIPPTGHSYTSSVTAPTCTEQGYTTYVCHCGETYIDDYADSLGHTPGSPATCTQAQICTVCQAVLVKASGHGYEIAVTKPTCTEQGYTTHTCSRCGHSYTDAYISATGHSFGEWTETKAPTETENGEKRRNCADCEAYETSTVAALAHSHDRWDQITLNAIAPTCTATGLTEGKKCAGCGEITVPQRTVPALGHSFGEWVTTKEPTETENGEKRRDCENCDTFETSLLGTLPHSHDRWESVILEAVAPTCTKTGLTEGKKCAGCGEITEPQEIVPVLGHKYTADVTNPTCTESGHTTYTCHCGHSYVNSYTSALGHSFGEWVETKAPTETESGEKRRDCENCDAFETSPLAALGHSHDNWDAVMLQAVAPTCTKTGLTEGKKCSGCGEITEPQKIVPALGHSYVAVITKPTCTESGYTTHTCHCGHSYVNEHTHATGHSFGDWYETKAPTESDSGEKRRDCPNCGTFETSPIPALGHSHDNWEAIILEAIAPTCTTAGLTEGKKCSGCGETVVSQERIPALGHKPGENATCTEPQICTVCRTVLSEATGHTYAPVVTPPSCTEKGYTTYICYCGETYVSDETDTLDHSFGGWYETKTPTETESGEKRRDCENCDAFETSPIAALSHDHANWDAVILEAVAPTCTKAGLTEGKKCSGCGEIIQPQETVPALGHTYDSVVSEPTCTGQGYTTHTCHCGNTYTDGFVPSLGHTPGEQATCTQAQICTVCNAVLVEATGHTYDSVVTAPTCTDQGYTTYTCHCGDTYTDDFADAAGHTYESAVTPPTCTEMGYTTFTCHCGDTYVADYVDATGHTFGEWVTTKEPTETENGEKRRDCVNCDAFETGHIAALTHNHDDWETVILEAVAPTCTETGLTEGRKCSGCGEIIQPQESVPALGHTPGMQATCTEDQICTVCQAVLSEATGHTYTPVVTPPTCTEKGYTTFTCHCGDSYITDCVDPIGHSWNKGLVTLQPTDQRDGEKTYTCTFCGKTRTEAVKKHIKLEHADSHIKIEAAEDSNVVFDSDTVLSVEKSEHMPDSTVIEKLKETVGNGAEFLAAYDISLILDNISVQPEGKVAVTIPLTENTDAYEKIQVVFVDDLGNVTPHETKVNEDGTLTFITDHFSYYAIVGIPESKASGFAVTIISILTAALLSGALIFIFIKKKNRSAESEAVYTPVDFTPCEEKTETENASDLLTEENGREPSAPDESQAGH